MIPSTKEKVVKGSTITSTRKSYEEIPGTSGMVILDNYRSQSPVHTTSETILHDIGDGVLCLEFTSKANSMGEGVLRGMNDAIQIAEEGDWKGLSYWK